MNSLPTIRLSLGGQLLELSPHTYVGLLEVTDDGKSSLLEQHMTGEHDPLYAFRKHVLATLVASAAPEAAAAAARKIGVPPATQGAVYKACMPLFMPMDIKTELPGPHVVLGVPFLRQYAATFNRTNRHVSVARLPTGTAYCTSCDAQSIAPVSAEERKLPATALLVQEGGSAVTVAAAGALVPALDDTREDDNAAPHRHQAASQHVRLSLDQLAMPAWVEHAYSKYRRRHA